MSRLISTLADALKRSVCCGSALLLFAAPVLAQELPDTDPDADSPMGAEKPIAVKPVTPREKPWNPQFYFRPLQNTQVIQSQSGIFLQPRVGGELGFKYRYNEKPNWTGRTRLRGVYMIGIPSYSMGVDARLGSFMGPQLGKYFLMQHGPDVWFNLYGTPASRDMYLAPTAGLTVHNSLTFQPWPQFGLVAAAGPGWVFMQERQPDENWLGLFHEVELLGAFVINAPAVGALTIGYQRVYDANGVRHGIVFSSDLL